MSFLNNIAVENDTDKQRLVKISNHRNVNPKLYKFLGYEILIWVQLEHDLGI